MITQTINLNLIPGSPLPRINVSQYDNGSRTLQFNLYNGVSPYEIPSGASVSIVGTKADKTGFEYACTFDGSLVSVDITDQMTVFAGEVQSELQIRQSGEILGTANFIINVESAALSDDTQISETDIPIIQRIPEILEEAEGYADDAKHWAEQSETAVTGAVTYGYNGIMGAKNLITYPYDLANTSESRGITYTVDEDGVVTATGTKTDGGGSQYYMMLDGVGQNGYEFPLKQGGKYILSGCPSGGSSSRYRVRLLINFNVDGMTAQEISDYGDGKEFTVNDEVQKLRIMIDIYGRAGTTYGTLTFKPMLRLASDSDSTYQPYAMTNKELTDGLNNTHGNYYGTCATAAATAAKVVTVDEDFKLAVGTTITVKFSNTNTASNCTLNVNGTGAKQCWWNTAVATSGSLFGVAGRYTRYMYDGTYWVFAGWSADNGVTEPYQLGFGYGTCETAESTVAKVVTLANYTLKNGGYVSVKFTNGVPANATMNINSKGAKPIYYHGSAITAGIIKAGDVATFIYNGSQYVLTGVDSLSTKVGNLETKMGTSDISAIGDGTVTGGISQLNSDLSEYLIRRDVSVPSVTLTANQSILRSVTCPSISGYSLFGINGVFCQNGNVKVSGAYLSIDSNEINIGLYNTTSSSQTASQFVCVVDYVKTLS